MKKIKLLFLFFVLTSRLSAAALYSDDGCSVQTGKYVWHQEVREEFRELLFSFNALLPVQGHYEFFLRVHGERWSDWAHIASFGAKVRGSAEIQNNFFSFSSDTLTVKASYDVFEIEVRALHGASLENVKKMYAATCIRPPSQALTGTEKFKSVQLPCTGRHSQMILNHPRHKDLCSPTSVSNALSYLLNEPVDPLRVASIAHDDVADIYGNWMLNVAAAYAVSGGRCPCYVQRLSGFSEVQHLLFGGTPVVVSVKGPLHGGATPYASGHLMTVYGYDAQTSEVLCIDSAFPSDNQTCVRYQLGDFLTAWGRRGNLAYVFN